MCWNETIEWDRPDGHDSITHFVEKLCAFCIAHPYGGAPDFPEAVAHRNANAPAHEANIISSEDVSAAKKLHARGASNEQWDQLRADVDVRDALANIRGDAKLFDIEDPQWAEIRGQIEEVVRRCIDNIRGIAGANTTKVLWLKRPHLIPICDKDVAQRLVVQDQTPLERTLRCIDQIRRIGRDKHNKDVLKKAQQHLTTHLPQSSPYRKLFLVRILEAVIWFDTDPRREHWQLLGWHG